MIAVAVVDRSRIFRDSLVVRLEAEPDVRVLFSGTSGADVSSAARQSLDVLVCDATLYGIGAPERVPAEAGHPSGEPAIPRPAPGPAVVLLADYDDRPRLGPAVRSGIRGWVPRDGSAEDLIEAIRQASAGGTWIQPTVLTGLLEELTQEAPVLDAAQKLLAALTPREREVLSCLADGLNRIEVAARLHVSTN
ncbi:MAG TPA: response regulator transcription factor, partial [Actinoplanes sp.]|nr:response regulator transcription factor [Actinoplanes sp.]